jgi:hypothetical protein
MVFLQLGNSPGLDLATQVTESNNFIFLPFFSHRSLCSLGTIEVQKFFVWIKCECASYCGARFSLACNRRAKDSALCRRWVSWQWTTLLKKIPNHAFFCGYANFTKKYLQTNCTCKARKTGNANLPSPWCVIHQLQLLAVAVVSATVATVAVATARSGGTVELEARRAWVWNALRTGVNQVLTSDSK